ncbi:hypothetical protein [Micromonospora violae]|uniref:hypothetical protein n=1 Tax=Micromonospora violae TaxID=1278207 RepID=UPI00102BA5E1|nr:hypothetical protein [Micromonospora violae]
MLRPDELQIFNGKRAVVSVAGEFDGGEANWTTDGRYVVTTPPLDSARQQLTAVEAATGRKIEVPCQGCFDVAPVGGSRLIVTNYDSVIQRIDLSADTSMVRMDTDLPSFEEPPRIVGGIAGEAVIFAPNSGPTSKSSTLTLFYVDWAGKSRSTTIGNGKLLGWVTSATRTVYSSPRLALSLSPSDAACDGSSEVVLVDPTNGRLITTDASAVQSQSELEVSGGGFGVQGLWWSSDGRLNAVIQSWRCDPGLSPGEVPVGKQGVWRLDDNKWSKTGEFDGLHIRSIDADTQIVVENDDRVYLIEKGMRTMVSEGGGTIAIPEPQ